jgi:two-component system chemotaxis response regulator CheY
MIPGSILVVGLSDVHREGLAIILRGEGYLVTTAPHSQAALRLISEGIRPRLVLLDLMTPVMDGFQFLARRREDASLSATPVILLTEPAGTESAWVDALGADGFIAKPLDVEEVLRIVRTGASDKAISFQHSSARNGSRLPQISGPRLSTPSGLHGRSSAIAGPSLHR